MRCAVIVCGTWSVLLGILTVSLLGYGLAHDGTFFTLSITNNDDDATEETDEPYSYFYYQDDAVYYGAQASPPSTPPLSPPQVPVLSPDQFTFILVDTVVGILSASLAVYGGIVCQWMYQGPYIFFLVVHALLNLGLGMISTGTLGLMNGILMILCNALWCYPFCMFAWEARRGIWSPPRTTSSSSLTTTTTTTTTSAQDPQEQDDDDDDDNNNDNDHETLGGVVNRRRHGRRRRPEDSCPYHYRPAAAPSPYGAHGGHDPWIRTTVVAAQGAGTANHKQGNTELEMIPVV
ncbi:hypothetical protein ACA910_007658 [Epithemia clementina (nom. ined.)]